MAEIQATMLDRIAQYVRLTLPKWYSDGLFVATSMEELGKEYYRKTKQTVRGITDEQLKCVIQRMQPRMQYENETSYYIALCKIMGINSLPKDILVEVNRIYKEIFIDGRNIANAKGTVKIGKINQELARLKNENMALERPKSKLFFVEDISQVEAQLKKNYRTCAFLKSQKEQIQYTMRYMNLRLNEFAENPADIDVEKKKRALDLCKEKNFDMADEFGSYKQYLDISIDLIDRPYTTFFKVKIYTIIEDARKQYYRLLFIDPLNANKAFDKLRHISIDVLNETKRTDSPRYNSMIKSIVENYHLTENIKKLIGESVCLRNRKGLLLDIIELYEEGKYSLFNAIVPTQIEGIFADYLEDLTTFSRFKGINLHVELVLKEKIGFLESDNSGDNIYPEVVAYFKYYFNDIVRNRIAHGRYDGTDRDSEIFATELLMDLNTLAYMVSRTSETDKMCGFISNHHISSENVYGSLFNDLIGERTVCAYDTIQKYNPIQVVYWIVNPYYEAIDRQVGIEERLMSLRTAIYSPEFWNYVLEQLEDVLNEGYDYLDIDSRFQAIINGMFSCGISRDAKAILGKVNETYRKIKALN